MSIIRYAYTEALREAAESFLINQFQAPTQFTEAPHLETLIEAAMHIVTGAAWVQPIDSREGRSDAAPEESGRGSLGEDDDEDYEE